MQPRELAALPPQTRNLVRAADRELASGQENNRQAEECLAQTQRNLTNAEVKMRQTEAHLANALTHHDPAHGHSQEDP